MPRKKENVIRTSVALTPTLLDQVRSMGRGVSPVVREALQEYLEVRSILPVSPQTLERIKEEFMEELRVELMEKLEEELEEQLEKQLEEKLKAELSHELASRKRKKRRSKNA